jgi:hypothetical protein
MNLNTSTPTQYSPFGRIAKRFLHTKLGAFIGFTLGLSGFNRIDATITRANGTVERLKSFNSRVDAGAALTASLISGTTLGGISSPSAAKYIAVSPTTLTPAKGDTTLSGELSTNGFTRALATAGTYTAPASLDGAASYVLTKTFTATGAQTVASAAIFDAVSTGNMFVEGNLASSATLAINDTLQISWTINL